MNSVNKSLLADISICVTLLGVIITGLYGFAYMNQVDASKGHEINLPYDLFWFQQAFITIVIALLPMYVIMTKPQLRLALRHELLSPF